MANLPESVIYPTGVFQLELDTPVIGGTPAFDGGGAPISGFSNAQAKQLADRTAFLKAGLELVPTKINDAITDLKAEIDPLPQYLLDSLLDSPNGVCPLDAVGLVPLANLPPISGGDVEGPASSVDGGIALFDGVTGKLLKVGGQLSGYERALTAGMNVTIDRTDPNNPVVNAAITGGGGGDVVGPASSVNNSVALFDGTTGKLLKTGGVLGSAAFTASGDYASVAQGALADTAVQPGDLSTVATTGAYADLSGLPTLGTAAATAASDYATAAQGALAGTALQPATIGTTVQGYDADTAKTDVTQAWTAAQNFGKGTSAASLAVAASAIDLSLGNGFTKTISSATTFTLTNVPASPALVIWLLELTNGGSAAITWWSGIVWASGSPPALTASGVDRIGFYTINGGTSSVGFIIKQGA